MDRKNEWDKTEQMRKDEEEMMETHEVEKIISEQGISTSFARTDE